MNSLYKSLILGSALVVSASAVAQTSSTAYFLDDYTYRYQMNPAFGNSKGFVSIPVAGNINVANTGTLNLDDVLYNVDGRTTTFLNPGVSAAEFLGNINDKNTLGAEFSMPVLAVGFRGLGGYNTITVSTHVEGAVNVPRALFSFLKEDITNSTYDITDMGAYGRAYAEVSLGHSHQITPELRVGANLKLLIGAANMRLNLDRANLTLNQDSWMIQSDANVYTSLKGAEYKLDYDENNGNHYVSGIDVDDKNLGPAGYGAAVDLGIVYTPAWCNELSISAAVNNLGFISWSNELLASTGGLRTFSTDAYTFNVDDDASNSFSNEIDRIKGDISKLYQMQDMGDQGSQKRGLGAMMHVGVEYALPVYHKLSFGLLNTTRFNDQYSWTDFRLSANWAPCKVFDAAISACTGTYGTSWGWMANLHVTGLNLFVGMDRVPTRFAKQGVPLNGNSSVNVGLNILF